MSLSPLSGSARLSERLNASRIRELASLILKSEHPRPSRALVSPLLDLLVRGPFDLKENFEIREPNVILLILELLPHLSEDLQLELWSTLSAILHRSQGNIHACRQLHLTERCLDSLSKTHSDRVANYVARVIEVLGSYSLSVKELKAILSHLYAGPAKTWYSHSIALIGALNNMSENLQLSVFFNFSGRAGAALTLPPISKWPTQSGFTFTSWIRIERPYDSQRDYYKPAVYWFRTGKRLGYSAHFIGNTLVLETAGKTHKKPQTHAVEFSFQSYQWYMLTVAYIHHRIRSSEVCCYVDGKSVLTAEVTLPSTDDVYDKCFLGSSPAATPDTVFQGQMAAVYLFGEPLSRGTVAALHKLGPTYKSQFKFDAESDVPLSVTEKKILFDGHLSSVVVFSYNAKAVDGQLCLESSPLENRSCFVHSPHATVLEGVEPIVTNSFSNALHSLGGIQAFLPLFSQLDLPQPSNSVNYTLSVKLLSLVFETARNSTSFMLQLVQTKSVGLIAYFLEKVSPRHLSAELVSCTLDFARYLSVAPSGCELLQHMFEQLIFNAGLWSKAEVEVQNKLYSQLATEFSIQPLDNTGLELQDIVGVPQLMFILREFYSLSTDSVSSEKNAKIRPYLLLIVKGFVTKAKGIQTEDLQSILNYLCGVPEEENLLDVLRLLLALVFEDASNSVVNLYEKLEGLNTTTKLLAYASEELTLHALKLIGKVLYHSSTKHRRFLIGTAGLFSVVKEKLLSAGQPVTIAMFNTLFEVLVNCPSRRIIDGHYLALDLSHRIEFPGMLAVMIELICTLHTAYSGWIETDALMRMQLFSYVSSLCAQNPRNSKAILQLQNCQHWLLVLADQKAATESDYDHLQEMLFKLFHTLLLYCFQEEQDGWRVWVETAAAIHAYMVTKTDTGTPLLPHSNMEALGTSSFTDMHSSSTSSSMEKMRDFQESQDQNASADITPDVHDQAEEATDESDSIDGQKRKAASFTVGDVADSDSLTGKNSPLHKRQIASEGEQVRSKTDTAVKTYHPEEGSEEMLSSTISTEESPSAAIKKHRSPKPPPLMISKNPSLSRTSSGESPVSPFFIPRSPLLNIPGKMPKFQWSSAHIRLLEDLLKSLQKIVNKWRSGAAEKGKSSLSEHVGDDKNRFLRSNIAHLLVLTTDNIVKINGGLKHLLAKSTNPELAELKLTESMSISQAPSLKAAVSTDPARVQSLLGLSLDLAEVMVLSGLLKLSTVEARMKMEADGALKQGLRLVLAVASLTSIEDNRKYKSVHDHYHREKQASEQLHQECVALLSVLGVGGCAMEKYFDACLEGKVQNLRDCQCLLSEKFLTLVHNVSKEVEYKQAVQQLVVAMVYYLSVMCVAKYSHILNAIGNEDSDVVSASAASLGNVESGSVHLPSYWKSSDVESSLDSTLEVERALPTVEQSIMPSSGTLYSHAVDISEQIGAALKFAGPFLCQLLVEHRSLLAKTLVGTDGRLLLTDAAMRPAESKSLVELVMLLCSQEWQASLQKHGWKAFSELLSEGRHMANFSDSYLKNVASKNISDFKCNVESEIQKFTQFEEELSLFVSHTIRTSNEDCLVRRAEMKRHTVAAKDLWQKIASVVDDIGSFTSFPTRPTHFSKLDLKEDSWRQRIKVLSNPHGILHEEASRKVEMESGIEAENTDVLAQVVSPHISTGVEDISLASDELSESLTAIETTEQDQAIQLLSLQCHMMVLIYAIPGTLVFTRSSFAFAPDDTTPEYNKAAFLSDYCSIGGKWLLQDVRAVLSRRYLHQSKALEIFFADRSSAFFIFEGPKEVKTVVRNLPKVGVGAGYGLPQTRSMSLASPQLLFKKSSMTASWERREVSNFEYLMFLNTIAGRSYNNLNQYPVFPWIISDFTSKKLDLNDPSVYRDLSKPMGVLNPARLKRFEERFSSWDDDRVPPFLYGTHYSTMAFVLHWLVRVEPFTSLHINFHDGLFDHGCRLFFSLQESWNNCQQNTSDVKELIPEFFYLPEMFLNENKFPLGVEGACEDGEAISDVKLPPWASSAHELIHIHREALESEYVSANLHHWVDLIFGYKQRGEEAIKAKNVFYYLTYTGAVDLDSISDPSLRKGLEDQIRHFGQAPAQLLKEPHPTRQPSVKEFPPQPAQGINPRDPALVAELQVTPDVPIGLVQLSTTPTSSVLAVSYNQLFTVNKWNVTAGTSSQPPVVSLEPDPQIAAGLKTRLGDPLDQSLSASTACFAATPNNDVIIVCGFSDNSFKSFATDSGELLQSVFAHRDIVSCIDFSEEQGLYSNPGDSLIASGSHDATILLWKWSGRLSRVMGLLPDSQTDAAIPLAVLTGHEQSIASVSVSSSLGLVVSGEKYGYCLVHSISGELLHKLIPTAQWTHPRITNITRNGLIVIHYADQNGSLAVFTCNGKQLCQSSLKQPTLALTVSRDDRYIITGGFDCRVKVLSAHNLKEKYAYERFESSIRSLHISDDYRFIFAGLASGSVAVLATHFWIH